MFRSPNYKALLRRDARARELKEAAQNQAYQQTSRGFAIVMPLEWLGAILLALCVSPQAWGAKESYLHSDVWLATWLGGAITSLPVLLAVRRPRAVATRHIVAVGQMLLAALLIHVTGGRTETQFHILASLAFLAYYRDWRVLLTATAVIAADQEILGLYFPELVFGRASADRSLWLEYTAWVVFAALMLIRICHRKGADSWEAVKRQAAIEMFTSDLEQTVHRRTRELEQAKESAEAANRAKTDFLAHASHEIRTPMSAILGMAELLSESSLNAEQQRYVEVFRNAGANLMMLINDLLDLSKIESGHLDLESLEFDLEAVVERAIELIASTARSKTLTLLSRIEPGTVTGLIGDPTRLTQVLLNLLGNAVKFTEAGEVMLTARNSATGQLGKIDFTVSDTGVGISEEKLEVIFEAFNQADPSTSRKYGGTGLGLSISRKLVERMGGDLTVTSAPEKGSTFRFSVEFGLAPQNERDRGDGITNLQGRRVLVISGNATSRLLLDERLRSWGMETQLFAAPDDALVALSNAKASERTFSLAILDDGIPATERAPAVEVIQRSVPGVPILVLASDYSASGEPSRDTAIAGFAVKPVRRSQLLSLVRETVKGGKPRPLPSVAAKKGPLPKQVERRETRKVLVAEDWPQNRLVVEKYLQGSPFQVTFAENGQSAVGQYLAGDFDLILMDLQMPVMDGFSATRAIRAKERERGRGPVPILALTASARPEDILKSQQAGCTAHLSKPISKRALLNALSEYLEPAAAEHERGEQRAAADDSEDSDMPDELKGMIPEYVRTIKQYAGEMTALLDRDEFEQIRSMAHNIKGTGGSYGFPELTQLAAALENAARAADASGVTGGLLELREFLERVPAID